MIRTARCTRSVPGLSPPLCTAPYRRRRAATCYENVRAADHDVRKALEHGDLTRAQYDVTVGLWHTLGLDSAIACRCPTNRRGFVYLWQDAARWEHPHLLTLARQALGCANLTEQAVRELASVAGLIKERYRMGVLAMVEQGEIEPAAWPLLCAALWRSTGDTPNPDAQRRILTALGYDSLAAVRQRQKATRVLATGLWQIARASC